MSQNKYTYSIPVSYYIQQPNLNGDIEEVEKTETIEVLKLQRTNKKHAEFILKLMEYSQDDNIASKLHEISTDFVSCAVTSPCKNDLLKDIFACVSIWNNEDVEKDIERFFTNLGKKM